MTKKILRVAVTGGAGQINYNLLFRITAGEMFGPDQPVILNVLELPVAMKAMEGVVMELEDCSFPLLQGVNITDDVSGAMRDVHWALLIGAKPRGPGMERADLLQENGLIFKATGQAINKDAASDIRILVVGNPCNTNCLIAMHNAPDVPKDRFHAMTRLDQNRATWFLAQKAGVPITDVKKMVIWGNHSTTQVVDYHNALVHGEPAEKVVKDVKWLQGEFSKKVAGRGAAIIEARGKSSAASAANAAIDAVKALLSPTPKGDVFSSAVVSDGNPYGIPEDLIFSFPCHSKGDGNYEIAAGFQWDDFLKSKIKATVEELQHEKEIVRGLF